MLSEYLGKVSVGRRFDFQIENDQIGMMPAGHFQPAAGGLGL